MQNYDNTSKNASGCKAALLAMLKELEYQIMSDNMTVADINALYRAFAINMDVSGTVEDFAKLYGQSVANVRNVIHRNIMPTPKRKVLYSLRFFQKIVPAKWRIGGG